MMIRKTELSQVRKQLHQAVQLLAACGISFLEKRADDSHTNMAWKSEISGFVSSAFGPENNLSLALNCAGLKYLFSAGDKITEFALAGMTENKAVEWLKKILTVNGMDISRFTTDKHYEIPAVPQAAGAPYDMFSETVFEEMAGYFEQAGKLLSRIAVGQDNVSPVRCWPHHFDLAMLITLEAHENPEKMKSVGLGLSPGDASYDQPYFYVSPWPYPEKSMLKNNELPAAGFWHIEGFTSAILLAEDYCGYEDALILDFLVAALDINRQLIQ